MGRTTTKATQAIAVKVRKPGSGRPPKIPASLRKIDRLGLKAFIEGHDGVLLAMILDEAGLAHCGLVGDRPLSRQTLTTRLEAIPGFTDASGTHCYSALDFAHSVRVRAGRPGPRRASAAKRSAADLAEEKMRVLDALARNTTKQAAARMAGLRTRRSIVELAEELGITEEDVHRQRERIATCAGCRLLAVGDRAEQAAHTCGARP